MHYKRRSRLQTLPVNLVTDLRRKTRTRPRCLGGRWPSAVVWSIAGDVAATLREGDSVRKR